MNTDSSSKNPSSSDSNSNSTHSTGTVTSLSGATQNSVYFESTPNPATLKFILGVPVTSEPFDCPTAQSAERSPLAAKIFGFPWTSSVFVGTDFITVTKQDWVDWKILAAPLSGLIQEHLNRGEPLVRELSTLTGTAGNESDENETDSDVVKKIKRILNQEIRPVVALDGGDIVFAKFENNVVYVHMKGSCSGCPSSTATLKEGIEKTLVMAIPEVREVVAV